METPKQTAINDLVFICKSVLWEFGHLVTDCFQLNYSVRRQIEKCYEYGVTRAQIEQIILKYLKKGA
jgi:hypothetical protein